MGLGDQEGKNHEGTRTKGISSEKHMVSYIGGGGSSPYHPSGYPPHTEYPVHGYPVAASPPPEYPGYGGYRYESNGYSHQTDYHSQWPQPGYHSPPHVPAPPPAYGHDAYPYQYGGHGGHGKHQHEYHGGYGGYGGYGKHQQKYHGGYGGYGGYGKHHEEHADYYRRHEEVDMYHHQQGYGSGYNNHGYGGKHQYGVTRGISDAKV